MHRVRNVKQAIDLLIQEIGHAKDLLEKPDNTRLQHDSLVYAINAKQAELRLLVHHKKKAENFLADRAAKVTMRNAQMTLTI